MKKISKKIIAAMLVLTCVISMINPINAEARGGFSYLGNPTAYGDFLYAKDVAANAVGIVGYNGSDKNITIPSEIDGLKVIYVSGFVGNQTIESVVIPETVKELGYNAFANCKKLKSVTLNEGLESILDSAFFMCPSLKKIRIPKSVTSISQFAVGMYNEMDDKEIIFYRDFVIECYKGTEGEKYATSAWNYTLPILKSLDVKGAPKKVTLSSVKVVKGINGMIEAKWKKVSGASGYYMIYSQDKNFTSHIDKVDVTSGKTTSRRVFVPAGKKIYVKVVAYKTIDGKKYFGDFSSVKSVKAK